ncbi:MAG: GGDEF domain-containing protein [Patescibacteria group bacterium]
MNLEWVFDQFGKLKPRQLWIALAAAYEALAEDEALIRSLRAENGRLFDENETLRSKNTDLQEMVGTDPLTGLPNRYRIDETVEAEVAYARRYGTPLSVLFVDVDHFKAVNDELGHEVGDAVLVELAKRFRETLRDYDVIGRHGGEEFLGVLRNNTLEQAAIAAERLRKAVADKPFDCAEHEIPVTISIGVAEWYRPELSAPLIHAADMMMYRAKRGGRNRVVAVKR